jgi:hypothetical protein
MPALLDALRGRMKQREANAIDTIAAAARAAARGESYDIGATEKALIETGMSVDDFEAAVERARRRLAWLDDFEKFATATNKVAKLEAAVEAEKAKFEAARKAFHEKGSALDADLATYRTARDKGREARDRLLDPRDVPGTIGEKYRQAVAEAEAAASALERAQAAVREQAARVKSENEWIAQLTGEREKQMKPDRIMLRPNDAPEGDSYRIQKHRNDLARAQRRKAEAEAQVIEAEKTAARTRRAVDALLPEVLNA